MSSTKVIKSSEDHDTTQEWLPDELETEVPPPIDHLELDIATAEESLLGEARRQAQKLFKETQDSVAEITRQAYQEGQLAAQQEASQLLLTAQGIYHEILAWRGDILAQSEAVVFDLLMQISRKLFGEGMELEDKLLKDTFEEALAHAKPLGDLRIHVHPQDVEILGPHWPDLQAGMRGQKLELVPDDSIRRGGCLIEGQSGSVDARVETQLDRVEEALVEALSPGLEGQG